MQGVIELIPTTGEAMACRSLGTTRGELRRQRLRALRAAIMGPPVPRQPRSSPLALSEAERQLVLDTLGSERFADTAPASVHARLLDEGPYLGCVRTMYRLLKARSGCAERRNQRRHSAYAKPELLATSPNQVWSWDITKLKGPAKLNYFHLYVILDIFNRYVVGWLIAERECCRLATQLIEDTAQRQNIAPGTLSLHADRGSSMRSKPVASLLVDLDITKTHSPDPIRRMTTRIPRRSSKRSNTVRTSPSALAQSKMHAPTAKPSSLGTTMSTATVALPT